MTALDDLIAAVEAGTMHDGHVIRTAIVSQMGGRVVAAFTGDLNAAHRLHEALLPGWDWLVRRSGWCSLHSPDFESITWEAGECVKTDILSGMNVVVGDVPFPARAWLLAILRALKAQEGRE